MFSIQSVQEILLNEVEVYGRDGMFDCRKEPTGEQKGVHRKTSILRTSTYEVLVTSRVRIDRGFDGSISVEILESELKNIRVFVDTVRLEGRRKIKKRSVKKIANIYGVDRLRQIRSKFDKYDTFQLRRCSGPLTDAA
ncbi:hypothetical protein BGZ99_001859 [Dissophora globulifera]|uniref:Uncharacterized protein n=1 Tax=Dissophora globulifera TaxID=979702 RepID=A0A9P6V0A9_9FUNG|nr:hypothetical protein BGZ99_001859 [Dissophora globulifera]